MREGGSWKIEIHERCCAPLKKCPVVGLVASFPGPTPVRAGQRVQSTNGGRLFLVNCGSQISASRREP